METAELVERLLAGERRALARVLTRIEDGSPQHLREAVRLLHPHTGGAQLIGITGSPGVGKSTLTNALLAEWRRRGRRIAVLAVDPSSPFSGGALLGDRVRMQDHVLDEGVFIRSMANRGHLGGLSWATPQALLVLDAAGFDIVVVETVGVGQAEVEVASAADTTIVALAPGMGDAIQAAKAGILEIADVFCVNKADRDGVDRTVRELRDMQHLGHPEWLAPICKTVASSDVGIAALIDAVDGHRAWLQESGRLDERRRQRARTQVHQITLGEVRRRFTTFDDGQLVDELAAAVAERKLDPYTAADRLLERFEG
ncbi:MAG: methylmalonyl Co-A mutase-associated GTPase MeaB [Actinomycetota bacterium]|jgi:LAO/AO transport system kinase|nr:methylmalonyl Co-A mutase-associated GTPase MeaB [Actinomycetota bacterium]MDQ3530664.1 methylmalonyl Co-A mutase-associated GTPase MeaB [Actinomycetota bacterium]